MSPTFREITLDIEKLAVQQVVPLEWLKYLKVEVGEPSDDWFGNTLSVRMVRMIATLGGESVAVPEIRVADGPWQAFKQRYFDVLLHWFPVRYRTLQHAQTWKAVELLPNVDLPDDYRVGARAVMVPR